MFLFYYIKKGGLMRTTSKPQTNRSLVSPSKEALQSLIDEWVLTDYAGKKYVTRVEIKHIHLNYIVWTPYPKNN